MNPQAQDLISRMLAKDAKERISILEMKVKYFLRASDSLTRYYNIADKFLPRIVSSVLIRLFLMRVFRIHCETLRTTYTESHANWQQEVVFGTVTGRPAAVKRLDHSSTWRSI